MQPPPPPTPRLRRRLLLAGQILGWLLLAAAIWMVLRQQPSLTSAWTSLRAAPTWMVASIILTPILNWLAMGLLFWVLTNQYAKVPLGEMTILMGSAWLLNLLPMRAGLLGRVAYQRAVHDLPVKDSVKITIFSLVTQAVAVAILLTLLAFVHMFEALAPGLRPMRDPIVLSLLLATLAGLTSLPWALGSIPAIKGPAPIDTWRLSLGVAIRFFDALVWTARYWLAFTAIGAPVNWSDAVIFATLSQVIALTPVQFGLREWATGLLTSILPATRSLGPSASTRAAIGVSADLLCRAAELLISIPVGIVCTTIVLRRLSRAKHHPAPHLP